MPVSRVQYFERFLDAVDKVTSGKAGGISEDRWLVNNYSVDVLPLLDKYLGSGDDRVVSELVLLFSDVRERAVEDRITELRVEGSERVRMACLGYLNNMHDDDVAIPELFDTLEHENGAEFHRAAVRMASIAREEDLPRIRRIYGQVAGDMRTDMKVVLEKIISRNPELVPKRDLILSIPVYPDESAFEAFLDGARDYLDAKYRDKVMPNPTVTVGTYNNIARALNKIRTRLYNESDNLQYYGPDKADRIQETLEMMRVVREDLSGKEVVGRERSRTHLCPRCGGLMVSYKGIWTCPDCGGL